MIYKHPLVSATLLLMTAPWAISAGTIDTGQIICYDNITYIDCPKPGDDFFGQDSQYQGTTPAYRDNGDGTVSDLSTGLMWSKGLDGHKVTPEEGKRLASKLELAGHNDWRVPNIKELYSLINFRGYTGSPAQQGYDAIPFINTDFFDFAYGDTEGGERYIDAQWLSSTHYVTTTMGHMDTVFGVNFADGRIKGYGYQRHGTNRPIKSFYIRYVRGPEYGVNHFIDHGDGTVTDQSSGLMWTRSDSGEGMNWKQALAYAENLTTAGYDDWRLPNAKELQYIVDYSRSPDTTTSAAIDPVFQLSHIQNEAGQNDYPFIWTSTTHLDGPMPGTHAAYVSFGRAIGQMHGNTMDVHGAGAQRSDPKQGSAYLGHGPQGDAQRVSNYVLCVRGGASYADFVTNEDTSAYPYKIRLAKIEHDRSQRFGPPDMAGGPPQGGNRQGFIAHLDKDGDKRVSRAEFDGPPNMFDTHDINMDGYIDSDEAKQVPPPPPPGGRMPPM